MELIIKPTGRCNFDCSFCSADGLDIAHPADNRVPEPIRDLIQKMKPTNIIVTGGEPLTLDPAYYEDLYDIAHCHIGLTSNMKDFYYHPDKWKEIMNHPDFGFITSFNYGDTRKWDPHTVYTEEMFRKVTDLYHKYTGKSLPFIAVIDESNEDRIMDHVYLAKELGTQVKINAALRVGRQGTTYPRYKLIRAYIDIIDAGYGDYEITCSNRFAPKCPFDTHGFCSSTIRACYVDTKGKLHYSICDDEISSGHEIPMDDHFPVEITRMAPKSDEHTKKECYTCELFAICHTCHFQRRLMIEDQDPNYCTEMKKLIPDLKRVGWVL